MRNDLSRSQKAVQAGHAVARFLLEREDKTWDNGTLVYLKVPEEYHLYNWLERVSKKGLEYFPFYEPDMNDEMTAMAVYGDTAEEMLKELSLL